MTESENRGLSGDAKCACGHGAAVHARLGLVGLSYGSCRTPECLCGAFSPELALVGPLEPDVGQLEQNVARVRQALTDKERKLAGDTARQMARKSRGFFDELAELERDAVRCLCGHERGDHARHWASPDGVQPRVEKVGHCLRCVNDSLSLERCECQLFEQRPKYSDVMVVRSNAGTALLQCRAIVSMVSVQIVKLAAGDETNALEIHMQVGPVVVVLDPLEQRRARAAFEVWGRGEPK